MSRLAIAATLGAALALALPALTPAHSEEPRVVAPPKVDAPLSAKPGTATAVLAGGCFWGIEGVYEHVKGVTFVRSGYAGGKAATAKYELTGTGMTGHAEAVEIRYDPSRVSYGQLLRIFFSVAHDPTQLDRQGPDVGSQYRSAIFPLNAEQAKIASAYIAQLNAAKAFPAPVVTKVETGKTFYPAEDYHQNYMRLNPNQPYIMRNDAPKLVVLQTLFPSEYSKQPVG